MYKLNFIGVTRQNPFLTFVSFDENSIGKNISLSPHKLFAGKKFIKEPRHLTISMQCFDWFKTNILNADSEIEKNISKFGVRLFKDDELLFTGYLDLASINYDAKTNLISFICYDALWILKKYSDIEFLFSQYNGYTVEEIVKTFVNLIKAKTNLVLPVLPTQDINAVININNARIFNKQISKILTKLETFSTPPNLSKQNTHVYKNSYIVKTGIIYEGNIPRLIVWGFCTYNKGAGYLQRCYATVEAKIFNIYNNTCVNDLPSDEYFIQSDWYNPSTNDQHLNIYNKGAYWLYQKLNNSALNKVCQKNNCKWELQELTTPSVSEYPAEKEVSLNFYFTGNLIPKKLYPTGFYNNQNKKSNVLNCLNMALIMQNLSLITTKLGKLRLVKYKPDNGNIKPFNNNNLVKLNIELNKNNVSSLQNLNYLQGNSTFVANYLNTIYNKTKGKWEINAFTIIPVSLNDIVSYSQKKYMIYQAKQCENGYEIKAIEVKL